MSEVTPIRQSEAPATIYLSRETAPLLLELCGKAAINGAQAHLLADLYRQASEAVASYDREA
jgi:hypothetical protein